MDQEEGLQQEGDTELIPKKPVMDTLEKMKKKNSNYKQYAISLKHKYREAAQESKKHYSDFIQIK